jgi:hypothetical protein
MILTVISPTGERWSVDPAPSGTLADAAAWVCLTLKEADRSEAISAIRPLIGKDAPSGKSLLNHRKDSGWQAILANPWLTP